MTLTFQNIRMRNTLTATDSLCISQHGPPWHLFGVTARPVEHPTREVMSLCGRARGLDPGETAAEGTPVEAGNAPVTVKASLEAEASRA